MKTRIVLDTFALLAFFNKEKGWEKVRKVIQTCQSSNLKAIFNVINLGELFYITNRRSGKSKSEELLKIIEYMPIEIFQVNHVFVLEAAAIKAENKLSYADAFCVNTALQNKGTVLTGDPEFKAVQDIVKIDWL